MKPTEIQTSKWSGVMNDAKSQRRFSNGEKKKAKKTNSNKNCQFKSGVYALCFSNSFESRLLYVCFFQPF